MNGMEHRGPNRIPIAPLDQEAREARYYEESGSEAQSVSGITLVIGIILSHILLFGLPFIVEAICEFMEGNRRQRIGNELNEKAGRPYLQRYTLAPSQGGSGLYPQQTVPVARTSDMPEDRTLLRESKPMKFAWWFKRIYWPVWAATILIVAIAT